MIELPVQTVMQHPVRTIRPNATVVTAARDLYDHDVGSLVVTQESTKTPIGIVTKSDINMVIAEGKIAHEISAEEIMSTPVISVSTTNTVQTAAELMRDHSIKKLPVTDETGELVGMLAASDLTYYLPTFGKKIHSHRASHTNE
ncbi:CBS domain-containing protein [Halalkalicoccus salilacus]|uniref:CBS domain-containing protein n=1 Tax=Halalkalicoccus salilacus TaxID=3117459 RepID=UPI00300EFFB4